MLIECVLILDGVDESCAQALARSCISVQQFDSLPKDRLTNLIQDYDAVVVRSSTKITKDIIDAGKRLKVIARAGSGLDNIDIEAAEARQIVVINSPDGNTTAVAEITCGFLISMARCIPKADAMMKRGLWPKSEIIGHELSGKTLGILGFGRVGKKVAARMKAFCMKIIIYDPKYKDEKNENGADGIIVTKNFETLLEASDYITIHAPLLPSTKNMINKDSLEKCKQGVKIVDCSRGGIINGADLLDALDSGRVGGAALDVFEKEPPENLALINRQNVICTPHIAGNTDEAQKKIAEDIASKIIAMND